LSALTLRPTTSFRAPSSAFAPRPAELRGEARDGVRMLVARPGGLCHARFHDVPGQVEAGDVVVVNDSATVAAQVDARWFGATAPTGSIDVVLHAATRLDDGTWVVELRSAPDAARAVLDARGGDVVRTAGPVLRLLDPYPKGASSPTGHGNRLWRAAADDDLGAHLRREGRPIAYGYLDRRYPLSAYQTVFGHRPGSAEMPSAGRPFTASTVTALVARGVAVVPVTLHTGVSSQEAGEGPAPERFVVPASTARLVNAARRGGGRVIAVGTTVTRALESAVDADGLVAARAGWTERVVTPADPPRVVTGLVTGWHDPAASHLLLVEAVAGPELTQRAYAAAVAGGYLWHEFGDSALLLP